VAADHGPKLSKPIENYGFVLEAAGKRMYFVGDVAVATVPPPGRFDLVAIPVGGAGFTFDPQGALNYLMSLQDVRMVIPVHAGGISDPCSPDVFRSLAGARFDVRVLEVGERVEL
jgi:L-ascorbate metabolism protein UlaG (beta-lactamase superfamily)